MSPLQAPLRTLHVSKAVTEMVPVEILVGLRIGFLGDSS